MQLSNMARLALFGLAGLLSLPAESASQIDRAVADEMRGAVVPAVGAAVIRNGRLEAVTTQGVRRNDGREAVRQDDAWLIGSTGKVMTSAMVLRLVERGVLSWDAPLEKMLPELAADMRPEYRGVTLLQLLSHHAGLPRDLKNLSNVTVKYVADTRSLSAQRLEYIEQALKDEPESRPGTVFSYSNTGFLIAAAAAERATEKSYEALMRQEVFEPLDMKTARLGNPKDGDLLGHQHGKPIFKLLTDDDGTPDMFAPAGIMRMSVGDWAKFELDQLAGARGKGALLKEASYRLMQTAQPGGPAGLDWGVLSSLMGRKGPVLSHAGSDGNWMAYVVLFPDSGNGVLAVANAGEEMGADKVLKAILKDVLPDLSDSAGGRTEGVVIGH